MLLWHLSREMVLALFCNYLACLCVRNVGNREHDLRYICYFVGVGLKPLSLLTRFLWLVISNTFLNSF